MHGDLGDRHRPVLLRQLTRRVLRRSPSRGVRLCLGTSQVLLAAVAEMLLEVSVPRRGFSWGQLSGEETRCKSFCG